MKRLRAVLVVIALLSITAAGFGLVLHALYGAVAETYPGLVLP